MNRLRHIARRRKEIGARYDIRRDFDALEESCVPSYCHANYMAAYAAWWRLFTAAKMIPKGPVLDFGAASGELSHLIPHEYHFVESNEIFLPEGTRHDLENLPKGYFASVAALDSLEHNDNSREIVAALAASLRPGGAFILSGPTENMLYRLGRKLSGFDGHYHVKTVYDLHAEFEQEGLKKDKSVTGPVLPLFVVSRWHI